MIYLVIYIVGAFISYYFTRKLIKREMETDLFDREYSWGDVVLCFFYALASWLGVIVSSIILLFTSDVKPPKWL